MAIRETELKTISAVETSDFVRTVTSEGVSSKASVSDVAKTIAENYAGSALGGSKRSIKNAIDSLSTQANTKTYSPVYVGDYICSTDYIPSCVLRIDDIFYSIDAPSRTKGVAQASDIGYLHAFSIEDNIEDLDLKKSIAVGHGNSIAYDEANNRIYIAPVWTYTSGTEVDASFLYVYDSDFTYIGQLNTPTVAMGVSYDNLTQKIYYYDYNRKVYVLENGTFALYTSIDFEDVALSEMWNRDYNQDFCVHDGKFYVSSPYGITVYGDFTKNQAYISGSFTANMTDVNQRFLLGELEGFEFANNGHLYAVSLLNLTREARNAFIIEIPTENKVPFTTNQRGNLFSTQDFTFTLSSITQNCFALGTWEIRSMLQLLCILHQYGGVKIPDSESVSEPYTITIVDSLKLIINGEYACDGFSVRKGIFQIASENASNKLTLNSGAIQIANPVLLMLTGAIQLNVELGSQGSGGNNFISIGYAQPLTNIRILPNEVNSVPLYVGDRPITNTGLYRGSLRIDAYSINETIEITSGAIFAGFLTSSSKSVQFYIPLPRTVTTDLKFAISAGRVQLRGVNGYFGGSSANSIFDLTSLTLDVNTVTPNGIFVAATLPSAEATNPNNTPISVLVSNKITINVINAT